MLKKCCIFLILSSKNPKISFSHPDFWKIIEQRSSICPEDIVNLKQILTLLGFTTVQSIAKLSTKTEMEKVELEFFKLKESEGFKVKYPNLLDEKFGIGMKTNIYIIANQIKKILFTESVNYESILEAVLADCKKVRGFFVLYNFVDP